jgi:membrane protein required for colicin V production
VGFLTDTELFRALAALGWIDRIALGVVVLAILRGVWIGLLREAFSIGALAAAFVAVRLWTDPAALWLLDHAPFGLELSNRQAQIAGVALVAIGAMFVVVAIGGFVRKRVHAAGLGLVDRLLGGALGAAEGALIVAVALIGVVTIVGRNREVLAGSHSVELLMRARVIAGAPPDVAAPPPGEEGAPEEAREIEYRRDEDDELSV